MQEDKQSVEFFKIKLMEKESQLKTLQAKFKKIQFKHSRDIKQLKISEERAKDLLKMEKTKLDKITKQAKEHQEQNLLLQHRLTELKDEKDKEIQNTRNKYNTIKQQVRSYERILPTHTFLTEIGAEIDQLPTYEDIFNNLKEKSISFDNLTAKHDQFKAQMEDKINVMEKSEEELNKKIVEKERNIKEMLPKVIELQAQISELRLQLQDAESKLFDYGEEMYCLKQKIEELQGENKQLRTDIEEMIQAHNSQLQNKELEMRELTQSELKRYEEQIVELNSRSEMKEQSYLQQISIYEEEVHELQSRIHKEKQRHEENYQEIKEIMDSLKNNLESDKRTILELERKNAELQRNLFLSTSAVEKLQLQISELKHDKQFAQTKLKQSESQRDLDSNELNEKDMAKRQLELKLDELMYELNRVSEEKRMREDENMALLSEIQDLKYRIENGNGGESFGRLSIPQNLQMEDELVRKRKATNFSIVEDTVNTVIQGFKSEQRLQIFTVQKPEEEQKKSRRSSLAVTEKLNELSILKQKNQKFSDQLKLKNIELDQLLAKVASLEENLKAKEDQAQKSSAIIVQITESLKNTENREVKLKQQFTEQNKNIRQLQLQIQDLKSNETTLRKKQQASKTTIETLTSEITTLKSDIKKQKQQKQSLGQEIKEIKAKQFQELVNSDKSVKELNQKIKELNARISSQQKSKNQLLGKEKTYQSELASLKQQVQKLNVKIIQVQKQIALSNEKLEEAQKTNKQLKKNNERFKYEVTQLEEENKQKDREIEMINDSLARERKERTLITVPSLQSLQADQQYQEEENFKEHYNTIGQKEGQIYMLEREVSNLKEQMEELKLTHKSKIEDMETEQNQYIQEIIVMKLKVAQSEMKAAEKEHLYNQLKKKLKMVEKNLKQSSSTSNPTK